VQSDLGFRVGGRVVERLVNVGDHVAKGQLLARLDPAQQQADLQAAQANLSAAEAQARQAASTLQRQKSLLDQGFTTRSGFDQAQSQAKTADNSVASAQAALAIAKTALADTELHADADGIITARKADVGEVVQAASAIFTVAQDGARDAAFDIDEASALNALETPDISLVMVGNPSVTATGKVREMAPTLNTATGTIRVKVGIDAAPAGMTLGALVIGRATVTPQPAFKVPWTALASLGGAPAVWIEDPASHQVSMRAVTLLAYESGVIYISGGLKDGDRVVTEGGKFLTPGQSVSDLGASGT